MPALEISDRMRENQQGQFPPLTDEGALLACVLSLVMNRRPASSSATEDGYSLAALFVFTAACAVPLALAGVVMRGVQQGEIVGANSGLAAFWGGAAGLVVGLIVGMHHYRQPRGSLVGALAGALIGTTTAPLALVKPSQVPGLFIASCIGAAILVGVSAALRHMSRSNSADDDALGLTDFEPPAALKVAPPAQESPQTPTPVA
jgi:hypothetical protein